MSAPQRPRRADVPIELTWDLFPIYATDELWDADRQRIDGLIDAVAAFRGRLGASASVLLECLRAREALVEVATRVDAYARLAFAADGLDPRTQAMAGQSQAIVPRANAALSFIPVELLALPDTTISTYLANEPEFAPYRIQLEDVDRRRGHILSPDAEELLASLGEALDLPTALWQRTTAADLQCPPARASDGTEESVTIAAIQFRLRAVPDRGLRRSAHEALAEGLRRHANGLAAGLASHIRKNVVLARARRYASAAEMILAPQRIPVEVYRAILRRVHDGMAPHARRLARLRGRVLGLDTVHHYDLDAPLDPALDPPCTFDRARGLILEGLAPLGEEYVGQIARAFTDRWVDRADNLGKRSGAFCATVYRVHPYVFSTWQDTIRNALILAHELGHGGHGIYASASQTITNSRGSLFFIEAPSTANEVLVGRYLLRTIREPRAQAHAIAQFAGTFTHNMITHMLEAHFEERLYALAEADRPLTLNVILQTQEEVFTTFFGDAVQLGEADRLYWAQQPHFYINLYPYTYAAGLACGCAVADDIEREGRPAAQRWLETLALGGSLPPLELAAHAGVDMTSAAPIDRAVAMFGALVDDLEAAFAPVSG
ncbi:MAG: oligoendopeptidase F [Chloroflexi bacterium]|nr:oligoendopeptidase F [Chloroflexota bacterium]